MGQPPRGDQDRPNLPTGPGSSGPPPPLLRSTGAYAPVGAPPALPREPKRRWWIAVATGFAVYLFLWLATLVQPVNVAGLSLAVPVPGLGPARIFGLPDRPFTVMVIGLDSRPSQVGGPARTDSILLLRVDPAKNRAGILSIPRDSMMQIPYPDGSYSNDRINTAYVYNWTSDDKSAAPDATAATIAHNLGIHVDHYIVFDQYGAEKLIQAAGGVTVKVTAAFGQDDYSDDDVNVVPQYFEQGTQHLNGYQAVAYGRIREGSSDFDRIRRQQQVAEGLVSELSTPLAIRKVPGIWNAYNNAVDTDMSARQTAGLFVYLKRIGTGRIVTRSLGDAAVSCSYCTASILLLEPNETSRIISEAFGDDAIGEEAAQLLVSAGVTP
jgi:LCP family protein required for cell wall assembly